MPNGRTLKFDPGERILHHWGLTSDNYRCWDCLLPTSDDSVIINTELSREGGHSTINISTAANYPWTGEPLYLQLESGFKNMPDGRTLISSCSLNLLNKSKDKL